MNVRFLDYVRTQVNPLTPRFEITGQCYFSQSTGLVSFQQKGFRELDPKLVLTVNAIMATQKQIKLGHLSFCSVSFILTISYHFVHNGLYSFVYHLTFSFRLAFLLKETFTRSLRCHGSSRPFKKKLLEKPTDTH